MSSRFICLIFSLVYYCSSSKVIKVFNLPKSFSVNRVSTVAAETKRVVMSVWLRQYEMFSTPKVSYRGTVVIPVKAHAQSVTNHSYLFFEYIPTSFMPRTASTRYKFRWNRAFPSEDAVSNTSAYGCLIRERESTSFPKLFFVVSKTI